MLQDRLDELPDDLDNLFEHMLRNIDPRYRAHSSHLLQLFRYYKINVNTRPIPTLIMSYAAEAAGTLCPFRVDEVDSRCDEMKVHLRTRCVGLLEEQDFEVYRTGSLDNSRIDYTHRSVAEFLDKPSIWAEIMEATRGTDFDASISLLRGVVQLLESCHPVDTADSNFLLQDLLRGVLFLARASEKTYRMQTVELLERFDSIMDTHCRELAKLYRNHCPEISHEYHCDVHWSVVVEALTISEVALLDQLREEKLRSHNRRTFMFVAARAGLTAYLEEQLYEYDAKDIFEDKIELLSAACSSVDSRHSLNLSPTHIPTVSTVEFFLRRGTDPNQMCRDFSPWENVLKSTQEWLGMYMGGPETLSGRRDAWTAIIRCLILHGANPHTFINLELMDSRSQSSKTSDDMIRCSATYLIRRVLSARHTKDWMDLQRSRYPRLAIRGVHYLLEEDSITKLSSLLEEKGGEELLWCRILPRGNEECMCWEQVFPPSSTPGQRILRNERYFEWLRKGKPQAEALVPNVQAQSVKWGQSQSSGEGQTQSKEESPMQPKEEEQAQLKEERRRDKYKKMLPWRKKE